MERKTTKVNSGFYRMNKDDLEFVRLPSVSNDDILKTFAISLVLILVMILGGIVFVMSMVFEPPSVVELIEHQKSMKPNR